MILLPLSAQGAFFVDKILILWKSRPRHAEALSRASCLAPRAEKSASAPRAWPGPCAMRMRSLCRRVTLCRVHVSEQVMA